MSLSYGAGGATAALGVVGLCTSQIIFSRGDANGHTDLLFTGDGEAFNVGGDCRISRHANLMI